jgi:hypothetical protein
MKHDTPSHDYTATYQISLIYHKRQKSYDSDTITLQKYKLFDLRSKVKDKMWSCWYMTPSHDYTHAYQISLTYLKRQKSYGPTDSKFANPFRLNKELTPFFVYFLVYFYLYLFYLDGDPPIFEFYLFKKHLDHSITKNQKILRIRNWYFHQINASNNVFSFIACRYKFCPKMSFPLKFSNQNFELGMPVTLVFYLFIWKGIFQGSLL